MSNEKSDASKKIPEPTLAFSIKRRCPDGDEIILSVVPQNDNLLNFLMELTQGCKLVGCNEFTVSCTISGKMSVRGRIEPSQVVSDLCTNAQYVAGTLKRELEKVVDAYPYVSLAKKCVDEAGRRLLYYDSPPVFVEAPKNWKVGDAVANVSSRIEDLETGMRIVISGYPEDMHAAWLNEQIRIRASEAITTELASSETMFQA